MPASYIAATGMNAMTVDMEIKANNIANANTTAFKREMVGFEDMLYQTPRPAGTPITSGGEKAIFPTPIQMGSGVTVASTYRDLTRGDPIQTQGPYDLYLNGEGYFQVRYVDGTTAYTRAGNFTLNNESQIVTSQGYIFENGFTIPQNTVNVVVNRQGEIWATVAGTPPTQQNIGTIQLATFPNPRGLEAIGENLYVETVASGGPTISTPGQPGFGQTIQSFLEGSNVQMMTEMVGMIQSQQIHQVCAEVVKKDSARQEAEIMIARTHG